LQEFPTENVFERFAQQLGFGREQRASEWTAPPGRQGSVTIENGGIANWHDVLLAIV
jgi:hypothetical protein